MTERLDIIDKKGIELQERIKTIPWSEFLSFGWVKVKITNGKATLITIEKTDRIE